MANSQATIDLLPEQHANAACWLPSGVTVVSSEAHGGSMRSVIQGPNLTQDATYQIVVTNEPLRRIIALVENPNQGG